VFERPYVGAGFEPVTAQIAEALGLPRPSGALVAQVDEGGPAERADLRPGDVVLKMNGAIIEHVDALGYRLATQEIGSTVAFTILRQGRERNVRLTLIRAPEGQSGPQVQVEGGSPFGGVTAAGLSPRTAGQLGLPTNAKGVVALEIDPRSPAAQAGLRKGDIIRVVNGQEIDTPATLQKVASQRTRRWSFSIERAGRTINQTLIY